MANILVIDDEPNWLALSKHRLQEYGHKVSTARNTPKALKMIWFYKPEVIVLDICMPEGGSSLLQILKKHWPEIHVIMHSVYGKFREDPSLSTADGFAVKSIDCADLVERIACVLNLRKKPRVKPNKTISRITGRSLRRLLRQLAVGP